MERMHWYSLLLLALTLQVLCDDVIIIDTNNTTVQSESYYAEERPWCPSSMEILPCICDGPQSFLLFSCDRITEVYSIKRAARSIPNHSNFGKFSLTNSRISAIESNILDPMSFEYVFLRKNTIKRIEPEFFDSSRDSLKRVEIVHNDLEKFPFKEMSSFPKLEYINLKYNSIKSISDEAFGRVINDKIQEIDLSFNKINHIGANSFKYLRKLEKIDLRFNKLTVINNNAFAVMQSNLKLTLNLGNNKIMYIANGAFENQVFKCLNLTENNLTQLSAGAFREVLARMGKLGTGVIPVGRNRFRCTCEKVRWIVELPTLQKLPILDFECSDKNNKNIHDLTMHDIGCLQ